jgi:hypothetical protein
MNGQWVWVRGQWVVPPQPGYYWVAGGWDPNHNWIEGHWDIAQAPPPPPPQYAPQSAPEYAAPVEVVTNVYDPPPPPMVEVVGVAPSPDHIWIGGYWGWDGHRRSWIRGHYELPPHGRHTWVAARWDHRGGNYVFVRGYWR